MSIRVSRRQVLGAVGSTMGGMALSCPSAAATRSPSKCVVRVAAVSYHLAMEPLDGIPVLGDRRGQDFQGHDPLHAPVVGLVDIAHAALAELLQDEVVADHEPPSLALIDGLGPEPGELAVPDEGLGQILAGLGSFLWRQRLEEGVDLLGGHRAAFPQRLEELIQDNCHGTDSDQDRHGTAH